MNITYLILIPKKKNPLHVSDYRPISLCNVIVKMVAKSIANRLKIVISDIIDQEQNAFIPGRLITNNIMVAFDCLHTLRQRKRGRNGLMAIKIE